MSKNIDFDINCERINAIPVNSGRITATVEGADPSDLIQLFNIEDFIDYFGEDDILKHIGQDSAVAYFNLTIE